MSKLKTFPLILKGLVLSDCNNLCSHDSLFRILLINYMQQSPIINLKMAKEEPEFLRKQSRKVNFKCSVNQLHVQSDIYSSISVYVTLTALLTAVLLHSKILAIKI